MRTKKVILLLSVILSGCCLCTRANPRTISSGELLERLRGHGRHGLPMEEIRNFRAGVPFLQLRSESTPQPLVTTDAPPPSSTPANTPAGTGDDPRIVTVHRGETADVQCEVIGMPPPLAYWTRDGRTLEADHEETAWGTSNVLEFFFNFGRSTLEHAATVAKLQLPCVSESDAGLYECHGRNGVEHVVSYTRIVVEPPEDGKPLATRCPAPPPITAAVAAHRPETQPPTTPPVIYMYTDMRLEYPGNDAQLVCRAKGHPTPTVAWYDSNDAPIKSGNNYTVLTTGDLLVRRINFGPNEPFRQFNCKAVNPLGDDMATVDLLAIARVSSHICHLRASEQQT